MPLLRTNDRNSGELGLKSVFQSDEGAEVNDLVADHLTQVIANYGPSIYGGLGYGTADQLYFSAGWLTSGLIANFISAFIMDLTGRVKLMVFGLAGCEIALIGAAVTISLNERVPTYGVQVAAVFFIFLHLAL